MEQDLARFADDMTAASNLSGTGKVRVDNDRRLKSRNEGET